MTMIIRFKTLFKKKLKNITSLDIFGLFILFFITALTYFAFSRKTEYLNVTIRLFNQDSPEYVINSNQPKSWYVEQIKVGTAQKNQIGETLVEVIDVYGYPNGYIYEDVYVTLRIKAVQNKITKQYIYEGSPLLIHDIKSFKIQNLLVSGEIIDIFEKERELKKFKVKVELNPKNVDYTNNSDSLIRGVENYVANLLKKGLTVKDSRNTNIIVVTDVEKKPGQRIVTTNSAIHYLADPETTRVTLHLDLLAEKINDKYLYRKKEAMLVGEKIWLTFDQVSVVGTITEITEN